MRVIGGMIWVASKSVAWSSCNGVPEVVLLDGVVPVTLSTDKFELQTESEEWSEEAATFSVANSILLFMDSTFALVDT
jgi:hypothetical protein